MNKLQQIKGYLSRFVDVSDEEAKTFSSYFVFGEISKKDLLIQPKLIAKKRYYLIDGAIRSFVINEAGNETTIALAIKDWWITDYNSYIYQQPATLYVEALESSEVLELEFQKEQELKKLNPKFETFFRIIAERGLASQQRRIITNLTHTAEARYDAFSEKYPQFLQKVPQYILASYLGMTPEFFSKIRNNKVKNKN